ncbi:hypothetical protein [Paenibacillus sp. D9]|uniref:hypothetical protein n=1 Tax=Paenibacillus TaxID=44249 RepID=UPI00061F8567|nr:hypothetical protein [Paenibacillus sp. D9]KKC45847.1 hypothetical protein VE23_25360 [Paenibacillus sp. D9]
MKDFKKQLIDLLATVDGKDSDQFAGTVVSVASALGGFVSYHADQPIKQILILEAAHSVMLKAAKDGFAKIQAEKAK